MSTPLISVIIPSYNDEKYISEAIDSVFSQTYSNVEIIVVDDGSEDDTQDIIKRKYGHAIKCFIQENKGPAAARNLGINNSCGEYIAFLDADDWWLPAKLETELKIMMDNRDVAFICTDWFCGKNGYEDRKSTLVDYEVWNHDRATFELLVNENFVNTSTVLVAKEDIIAAGLFNERLRGAEDRHMWLRLLSRKDALVIKEVFAFRRFHSNNTSRTLPYMESQLAMIEDLLTWPIIKNDKTMCEIVHQKKNDLNLSLAYRASCERRYHAASHLYWLLFKKGYRPLHCLIRSCLFITLSKMIPNQAR
jgi:glycosyltransferase involved in cell wall biosynthesis